MRIQVTQGDIDAGTPCCSSGCPIARAMQRALSIEGLSVVSIEGLSVGLSWITIGGGEYGLPDPCATFVHNFDAYGPAAVKPFEFEFEWPR